MDEREQLGKDLKKTLREIQKSLKFTEKQFKSGLSSSAAWGEDAVKKCRGDGTVSGIIRYLNLLKERLDQVSIQDIENSVTADTEKTIHLRFGESSQEFFKYGTFHVSDWLDMGGNIEAWLTYALSSERMDFYTKTKEYYEKSKGRRKLINRIKSKYSLKGLTGDSKRIKKIEQTKEEIKSQNALTLRMVKDKKNELHNYLSTFFGKDLNFNDHHSLMLFEDKINQMWAEIYNAKVAEFKLFCEELELKRNEQKETAKNLAILFEKCENEPLRLNRKHIPKDVKREVWRRDMGRCTKCGSRENLEYDHIIPVSKGGSSTSRNIELLCQSCNRKKAGQIM